MSRTRYWSGLFHRRFGANPVADGSNEFLSASLQGPETFWPLREFANVNCLALGIHLGVLLFVVAVPLSLLIARLPIGLYSLGTIEGAFVFLLSGLGLSGADAVAMSLSARILERL